jgi:thiamine biosynthesis lipoprotein
MGIFVKKRINIILLCILVILVAISILQTRDMKMRRFVAVQRSPERIMGTSCNIISIVQPRDIENGNTAINSAEQRLRQVESRMSIYLKESGISAFNDAPAGMIRIDAEISHLLHISKDFCDQTQGAFDITIKPLIQLWKGSAKSDRLPTRSELDDARRASNWYQIKFGFKSQIQKTTDTVKVDLGGIAKGYGVDEAIKRMINYDIEGGSVDIGGDMRCFGKSMDGDGWIIEIRNPYDESICGKLKIDEGAVCTSGNYNRFNEIQGKKYSHIIDPRTGWPADQIPSVTVIAPDTVTADAWATALSVLGKDGLNLVERVNSENEKNAEFNTEQTDLVNPDKNPDEKNKNTIETDSLKVDRIEAMIIENDSVYSKVYMTKGFKKFLITNLPETWIISQ